MWRRALPYMASWDNPVLLSFLMEQKDLSHHLYDTMRDDDLSEVVMVASRVLNATDKMPQFKKKVKCEEESDKYRKRGNEELQRREFQKTLQFYNKALLMAPAGSLAMKLAYSNRSALLFSLNLYTATLEDIETVFALGCPEDLVERLEKRKNNSRTKITRETAADNNFYAQEDFFRFNVKKNPEIPCASNHVGVTVVEGIPEIIATKDIAVGQLVAVEEAFISENGEHNQLLACHYCHKFDLNLIPCERCCFALFCDSECRSRCNEEYHDIECHIMEFLRQVLEVDDYFGIAVKSVIKMWKLSKGWSAFISASEEMGRKMTRRSSESDMFDAKNPCSLLNFDDEQHLNFGRVYNHSWHCAVLLHHLTNVPSFLPETFDEQQKAKRAIARLTLGIRSYVPKIMTIDVSVNKNGRNYTVNNNVSFNQGYFLFAGKLKHKCEANLMVVGLGRKIALIAIKPIQLGEDLTISYILHTAQGHTLPRMKRAQTLYQEFHIVCSCHLCKPVKFTFTQNAAQKACMTKLDTKNIFMECTNAMGCKRHIKSICNVLTLFYDVPYSREYDIYIGLFIKCMWNFQVSRTRNTVLVYRQGCLTP